MRPATDALIVIDVQNDFCAVAAKVIPQGDMILTGTNLLM